MWPFRKKTKIVVKPKLKRGELLVVKVHDNITQEDVQKFGDALNKCKSGQKLIVNHGVEFIVLKKECKIASMKTKN